MNSSVFSKNTPAVNKVLDSVDGYYRTAIFSFFETLETGTLLIEDGGEIFHFGNGAGESALVADITIEHPATYKKMFYGGSIGAAEAYIEKLWNTSNLSNVIQVIAANIDQLNRLDQRIPFWKKSFLFLLHRMNANSRSGAKNNIAAHYDLSNEFFGLMLDPTMMYSAAVFPDRNSSLEQASIHKLDRICEKLELAPGDHLLEIGAGWGGMALHAAKRYGCKVTTTTISAEQHAYVDGLIKRNGLEDRITLLFEDYRNLTGSYDKIVSIEMIEAVGHQYYPRYFDICNKLLKPDGLMLIQSITIADQRYRQALASVDFIQKYIFPGGSLPSNEVIAANVSRHTDMQIISLEDITEHYATTLRHWRANFLRNTAKVKALGFDEGFLRKWDYYLCYCEGGFRQRVISTAQYLLAKPRYRFSHYEKDTG